MLKNLIILLILNQLLQPATGDSSLRRSCGGDLIARVAKICLNRGGYYNRLEYWRRKRTIIAECCRSPCYDSQLYLYCSSDDDIETISGNDLKVVDIIV